jgi:hypothetical protein
MQRQGMPAMAHEIFSEIRSLMAEGLYEQCAHAFRHVYLIAQNICFEDGKLT